MTRVLPAALMAVLAAILPIAAQAYIGPGAGMSVIASLLAVGGAVLLALFGLVLFPIRMILKARARARAGTGEPGGPAE